MSRRERFGAWVLTGPVGRLVAFVVDLTAYWVAALRRRLAGSRQRLSD